MNLLCPVSPGELIDKITILEIKKEKIQDPSKNKNVIFELSVLNQEINEKLKITGELKKLIEELKQINLALWDIEDKIRECESLNSFDEKFIELARSVYKNNDVRAKIKYKINVLLKSDIVEEKSYKEY